MKVFIPAAGLGTRLRPFTLTNPKALVEVDGVPMLERVILRLKREGFDEMVINLHHFGDKIEEFVKSHDNFGVNIAFSDERAELLDTGGALLHARRLLGGDDRPFLIHNVDILSDAPLRELIDRHQRSEAAATLLVSDRESSRRLI
ncbi:MAG: NTP transferase domain-containing protein, partial [Muribaculaceae bacterium]|nr:NTP transferase domain-containing protein [Muribaculaceae bacterium]